MDCNEALTQLHLYRDFRYVDDLAALEEHLLECEKCRKKLKRIGGEFPRRSEENKISAPTGANLIRSKPLRIALIVFVVAAVLTLLALGVLSTMQRMRIGFYR